MNAGLLALAAVLAGGTHRDAALVVTGIDLKAAGSLFLEYRVENHADGAALVYTVPEGSRWPDDVQVQTLEDGEFVTKREPEADRGCARTVKFRLPRSESVDAVEPVTGRGAGTYRIGIRTGPPVDGDHMMWSARFRFEDVPPATPGVTPLMTAAAHGDIETLRRLLAAAADADAQDGNGSTALHWAAALDQAEACAVLVEAGAEMDAANAQDVTPASMACRNNALDAVRALHRAGADLTRPISPALSCRSWATYHEGRGDSRLRVLLDELEVK